MPTEDEDADVQDAYEQLSVIISLLLESDAVMDALFAIPVEPGSACNMAEILTAAAKNLITVRTYVERYQNGE